MKNADKSLITLKDNISKFAEERDWDKYHSPKNLSMALAGEVGELLEHFQWLNEQESIDLKDEKREAVAYEIADVFIYLLRLGQRLNIDLVEYGHKKMSINEVRYPVDKVKGDARRAEEYSK
tara:strand:- start:307 stop:672 length:366 start_codon:yes stop_codon:yes gene_type:complete